LVISESPVFFTLLHREPLSSVVLKREAPGAASKRSSLLLRTSLLTEWRFSVLSSDPVGFSQFPGLYKISCLLIPALL
jgi:hypothetical protein